MKLVILHYYSDGYTYSGVSTIPIERESEEALIVELEQWAKQNENHFGYWKNTGIEANTILDKNKCCAVEVMTMDKWFERECVG